MPALNIQITIDSTIIGYVASRFGITFEVDATDADKTAAFQAVIQNDINSQAKTTAARDAAIAARTQKTTELAATLPPVPVPDTGVASSPTPTGAPFTPPTPISTPDPNPDPAPTPTPDPTPIQIT